MLKHDILRKFIWWHFLTSYVQGMPMDCNGINPQKDCNANPSEALNSYKTVEDFDRCAPYLLPDYARNYFQAAAGRQVTLRENEMSYCKLRILPRVLRNVSNTDLSVTVLGERVTMPILVDPVAFQKLASDLGEVDTVRAVSKAGSIMVLSSLSTTLIEDVAREAPTAIKWMQIYIFPDRRQTVNLIKRAEAAGFKAIVVTIDSPIPGPLPDDARKIFPTNPKGVTTVNLFTYEVTDPSLTFSDLAWVKRLTNLPIVAKGVLTPDDALLAARYGASAILVSNHGGRQLDFEPATIDVLPAIANAVRRKFPSVEVYVDGGVRNGFSVFKALACGAHAVFVGRPIIWGLASGGEEGVSKVLGILREELQQTMMLAGAEKVGAIERTMVRGNP